VTHEDCLLRVGKALAVVLEDAAGTHQGAEKYLTHIADAMVSVAQARGELKGMTYMRLRNVNGGKIS